MKCKQIALSVTFIIFIYNFDKESNFHINVLIKNNKNKEYLQINCID